MLEALLALSMMTQMEQHIEIVRKDFKTPAKIYVSLSALDLISTQFFLSTEAKELNPLGQSLKSRLILETSQIAVLTAIDVFSQNRYPKVTKFVRYLFVFAKGLAFGNNMTWTFKYKF